MHSFFMDNSSSSIRLWLPLSGELDKIFDFGLRGSRISPSVFACGESTSLIRGRLFHPPITDFHTQQQKASFPVKHPGDPAKGKRIPTVTSFPRNDVEFRTSSIGADSISVRHLYDFSTVSTGQVLPLPDRIRITDVFLVLFLDTVLVTFIVGIGCIRDHASASHSSSRGCSYPLMATHWA